MTTNIGMRSRSEQGLRRVTSILLLSAALAGCASNGRVPPAWTEARKASSSCDQLQGRFANAGSSPRDGQARSVGRPPVVLTQVLEFSGTESNKESEVRLAIDADGVAKFAPDIGSEGAAGARTPSTKLVLSCDQGVLSWSGSIRDLRDNNIGDPLAGPDRISFRVQRGADRALYVETHEVFGGLVYMFIPFGGADTRHYRFPAAD